MPQHQRVSKPSKQPLPSLDNQAYKERDVHNVGKNANELLSRYSELVVFCSDDVKVAEGIKEKIHYFFENDIPDENLSPRTSQESWKQHKNANRFAKALKATLEDLDEQKRRREPISAISPAPPRRRHALSKEERRRILLAVKRDPEPNFSRIALKFGVSDMTITRIAASEGIQAKGRGGNKTSDEQRAEVLALLPLGYSYRAVAAEVGVSHMTVGRIAKERKRLLQSLHLMAG